MGVGPCFIDAEKSLNLQPMPLKAMRRRSYRLHLRCHRLRTDAAAHSTRTADFDVFEHFFLSFPIHQPPKPAQVKRARAMRSATTEAETRLWRALRHRLPSHHFRRQVPIGDYIVDFCCYGARLVIEVDGNQHGFDEQRAHDARRTEVLKRKGFQVIRFANEDVFRAMDSVLDTIFAHLENRPDQCEGR